MYKISLKSFNNFVISYKAEENKFSDKLKTNKEK